MGVKLLPVELPPDLPTSGLGIILSAEAAAAFYELTRSGQDDQMVQQTRGGWPNSFRTSRFIPAVEYIQANRIRSLLMQRMDEVMASVDVFVTPTNAGNLLSITNWTGHPQLVLPQAFQVYDLAVGPEQRAGQHRDAVIDELVALRKIQGDLSQGLLLDAPRQLPGAGSFELPAHAILRRASDDFTFYAAAGHGVALR